MSIASLRRSSEQTRRSQHTFPNILFSLFPGSLFFPITLKRKNQTRSENATEWRAFATRNIPDKTNLLRWLKLKSQNKESLSLNKQHCRVLTELQTNFNTVFSLFRCHAGPLPSFAKQLRLTTRGNHEGSDKYEATGMGGPSHWTTWPVLRLQNLRFSFHLRRDHLSCSFAVCNTWKEKVRNYDCYVKRLQRSSAEPKQLSSRL